MPKIRFIGGRHFMNGKQVSLCSLWHYITDNVKCSRFGQARKQLESFNKLKGGKHDCENMTSLLITLCQYCEVNKQSDALQLASYLILNGASLDKKDMHNKTVVDYAVENRLMDVKDLFYTRLSDLLLQIWFE